VSFGRIALAWTAVAAWLLVWMVAEQRLARPARSPVRSRRADCRHEAWWVIGEALLLTLLGALWIGSLGAGSGWLVFVLVGALSEWPPRTVLAGARVARVVAAGALLSRLLGA
jgi:hypothetical protein